MKKKAFDCVEMKRQGARQIQEATAGMSLAEQIDYWRQRDAIFRQEQDAAREAVRGPQQAIGVAAGGGGCDDVIDAEFEEKK
jgi:hypothetical protein